MNNNYKICVIGLGYVGLPLARLFSTKYQTVGFDMNQSRVDLYDCNSKGVVFGELTFTPASGLMGYFTTDALIKMNPNTK